jgi:hypothetical protein
MRDAFPLVLALLVLVHAGASNLGSPPDRNDLSNYLSQEIQGKKHAWLSGNAGAHYIGGEYRIWRLVEDETIGLTRPFVNDLRARGTGLASHSGNPDGREDDTWTNVGTGNDYDGWDFHKYVRGPSGTVITDDG